MVGRKSHSLSVVNAVIFRYPEYEKTEVLKNKRTNVISLAILIIRIIYIKNIFFFSLIIQYYLKLILLAGMEEQVVELIVLKKLRLNLTLFIILLTNICSNHSPLIEGFSMDLLA